MPLLYAPGMRARMVCPVLQGGRERRGGGFDGRAEFREHGEDAAEHGGGEDDGEKRSFVHVGSFHTLRSGCFKNLFHELDAGSGGILSGKRESSGKNTGAPGIRLKKMKNRLFY